MGGLSSLPGLQGIGGKHHQTNGGIPSGQPRGIGLSSYKTWTDGMPWGETMSGKEQQRGVLWVQLWQAWGHLQPAGGDAKRKPHQPPHSHFRPWDQNLELASRTTPTAEGSESQWLTPRRPPEGGL